MRWISASLVRGVLLAGLAVLAAPFGVFAEEEAKPATPEAPAEAAAEAPPIRPIPVEDVSTRAEAAVAGLAARESDEHASAWLEKARAQIAENRRLVAERIGMVSDALDSDPKVRTLEDLGRMLRALRVPLESVDALLGKELEALSTAHEQVEEQAEVWKKTLENARAVKASDATLLRIRATQREIAKTLDAQLARRNEILTLRDGLVEPRSEIDAQLKRVHARLENRVESMFESRRGPIWSSELRGDLRREIDESWWLSIAGQWDDARDYALKRPQGIVLQLVLFAALALGLRALGARVRRRENGGADLENANAVFELPTAMAFVGALSLSWKLHPLAPVPFMEAVGALAIVPSVLIARRLLPGANRILIGIVFLFFTDRIRGLLVTLPGVERGLFDLELLGAVVFLVWLLRRRNLAEIPPEVLASRSLQVVRFGMRAATVLLALSLLADVFGLGDLADLIGTATLLSAYWAVFTFAVLRVAQGIVAYLLLVRPLRLLRGFANNRAEVRRRVAAFMQLAAWTFYVYLVLGLIGIRSQLGDLLGSILSANLAVGALSVSLGDVLVFALTIYVSFRLARLVDFVLNQDVFSRIELARGVPYAISTLVRYTIIVFGLGVALAAAGIELSKLTVIAGGLGVGIGFGLQSVVNNFVSGLILLFERPLKVGDVVQLANGLWGEIGRIGIRASVVRTFDGAEVIVPNGLLVSEQVTNWTLSDHRRRLELNVGVEYGTPAQRVIDLLLEVADAHPKVLDDPEPLALFMKFGDSSLDFMLRVWIGEFGAGFSVLSELSVATQAALAEAGIGVPFPQRDLHLKSLGEGVANRLSGAGARPEDDPPRREEG